MGLFLGPFSGHAVGGGGGTGGPGATTPPPGMGDEAGQRAEIDTINRSPLHLLRTTMNKHKPKFLKIVPPGQQVGTIAPPYTWDGRERDDWAFKLDKPKNMREGEFDAPKPPKPHSLRTGSSTATAAAPKPAAASQAAKPASPPPSPAQPAAKAPDPRHARVDAINAELKQLHQDVAQLMAKQHELTQQGKSELQQRPNYKQDPEREVFVGNRPGSGRYLTLPAPLPQQESETPRGIRPGDDRSLPELDRRKPTGKWGSPSQERKTVQRNRADAELLRRHRDSGEAKRDYARPPQSSFALINVHQQLAQKHARIQQLTQELKQLRQQMQMTHESRRLRDNNLHRLSLLLK